MEFPSNMYLFIVKNFVRILYVPRNDGTVVLQLPNRKNGSCEAIVKNEQIKVVDLETGKVLSLN